MTPRQVISLVKEAADVGLPISLTAPEAVVVADYIKVMEAFVSAYAAYGKSLTEASTSADASDVKAAG